MAEARGGGRRKTTNNDRDYYGRKKTIDRVKHFANPPKTLQHWRKFLGFKRLEELKVQSPNIILATLYSEKRSLKDALNDREILKSKDVVFLFLHCISKSCQCSSTPEHLNEVLNVFLNSKFMQEVLVDFLRTILFVEQESKKNNIQAISNLIEIIIEICKKTPNKMISLLGSISMLESILITRQDVINQHILNRLEVLKSERDRVMQQWQEKSENADDEDMPPDDFRKISIYPTPKDLTTEPFLRRNKSVGAYTSADQYLDVQFRLLREDFVGPLREGISDFLKELNRGKLTRKMKDIRVYRNVKIISPSFKNEGLCYTVSFDTSPLHRVNWESSKRLIFGSLVCLSSDNFKSQLFATIIERKPDDLKHGYVCLQFTSYSQRKVKKLSILTKTSFIMAETKAYFEAYKHVLVGIQNLHCNFAFNCYIVSCNLLVKEPNYLHLNANVTFDLRPILDDDYVIDPRQKSIEFNHKNAKFAQSLEPHGCWPGSEIFNLDESQYRAVKDALLHEFVLAQGPPGTGKTYIGLKIVKVLLHNQNLWNKNNNTGLAEQKPMLIVCYTNHALDQFMEGIMKFYRGNILRVGGRSSSEKVKKININNKRHEMRLQRTIPSAVFRMKMEAKNNMTSMQEKINRITALIESARKNILHEEELQHHMGRFRNNLIIDSINQSVILIWLGIEDLFSGETMHFEMEKKPNDTNEGDGDANALEPHENSDLVNVIDEIDVIQDMRQLEIDDDVDNDEVRNNDELEDLLELGLIDLSPSRGKIALDVSKIDLRKFKTADGWQISKKDLKRLKQKIKNEIVSPMCMIQSEIDRITDIWTLSLENRWKLYRTWVNGYVSELQDKIMGSEQIYQVYCAKYSECLMEEDKIVMQNANVIGMTTSGAARYQYVLQEIAPKIIVVEEAAEVLEAHIITTLNDSCEHLILIGDHKQLKPNPNVYKLAKDYNLDISLFERMINNKFECNCLNFQHRMRPEISSYLQIIYKDLKDHPVVEEYENIKGISSNVFFINHSLPETNDEESSSHSNEHEAQFLTGLCSYLILQGYKPKQITILTLYSGQLFLLKKYMPKAKFEGVQITVVDNYQGEENDIILLSLVRSNEAENIGFVKIENRICVALSRAKAGLYVIGNLELMKSKSELWNQIVAKAIKNNNYGTSLPLLCQNHPNEKGTMACFAQDFPPEGGCMKLCEFQLDCGHVCAKMCHVEDTLHKKYKCNKPCPKIHEICKHKCKRLCYKPCGDCIEDVEKLIPQCQHKQIMKCCQKPELVNCKNPCEKILPCGHKCKNFCFEDHTLICTELVAKTWKCGHSDLVSCFEKDSACCPAPCGELLKCEHLCRGTCGKCLMGRIHIPCQEKCERNLVCGHICPDNCYKCASCKRFCENSCIHSKCQKKCGSPCVPCQEPCEWKCKHIQCNKLCHEPCDREKCNKPCKAKLDCGHKCIGLCGEKCPKYCRHCDKSIVTEIFFGNEDDLNARFVELECGHIFEVNGLDQYMSMSDAEGDNVLIKLKVCPKCSTPIRRNLRYGNIIKTTIKNIELVKQKFIGNKIEITKLEKEILDSIESKLEGTIKNKMLSILKNITEIKPATEESYTTLKIQLDILEIIKSILNTVNRMDETKNEKRLCLVSDLKQLIKWCCEERYYISKQESSDINFELERVTIVKDLLYAYQIKKDNERFKSMTPEDIFPILDKWKFVGAAQQNYVRNKMKEISKCNGLGISTEEKVQIVNAMGNDYHGKWFTCPNGHVYVIGDCGGATNESRCNECGAAIGGSSHRLRRDNRFANFMDGASSPAWPSALN